MLTEPKSIKVLVYLADGTGCRLESLETVEEDLTDSTLFYDGYVDSRQDRLAETHRFLNAQTYLVQSLISLQPDMRKNHWPCEAWRKRAVVSTTGYHVFFTVHSGNGLFGNPLFRGYVYGDVFVLELSDDKSKGDEKCYVDLDVGKWDSKKVVWKDIAMEIKSVKSQYEQLMVEKEIIRRSSPV